MTSGPTRRTLVLGGIALLLGLAAAVSRVRSRTRARAGAPVGAGTRTALHDTPLTVFAHRGFASDAPENTTAAVRYAASRADAIEIDVRRCGSGELVCIHDETLERLTGVDRRVDETDWETLCDLEVGDGAPIARFEDVLAVVPDDVLLNVELKERGLAADVLEHLSARDGDVLVSSFDPEALAEVRARDEAVPLAYVFRRASPTAREALEIAAELECTAVHPRADLCLRTAIVPRAHRRGLAVNAWTVDSWLETALLALAGVDGVFADSNLRENSRP